MRRNDCYFKKNQIEEIDYRDSELLLRFMSNWGRIRAGKNTGTSSKYQRKLSTAIKRARFLGLLPYVKH